MGGKMRAYKITDENDCTFRGFKWYEGKVYKTNGKGELCSSNWIHFYRDKRLAVILNPIQGNYQPLHLWLCEAGGTIKEDNGLKWGCTEFRMIKQVRVPKITLTQKVAFAILCSLKVYTDSEYKEWAEGWLQNKNRTAKAAWAAGAAAWAAAAARAAARAAEAAAEAAAKAAAEAAGAAAGAAAEAAGAAAGAARAVAGAARAVRVAKINLVRLATECLKY